MLPLATISLPFNDLTKFDGDVVRTPQIVLLQKENIGSKGLFALNQAEDLEAKTLELQAEAIDAYYKKYDMPLMGYGMKMVLEAKKHNLDWRLIAAISVIESTGGKFACKNPNAPNAFLGWGSCKFGFETKDKAIEVVSWNLGGGNEKTARYYANKTTEEKLRAYNPPSIVPNYVPKVMKVMNEIGDKNLGLVILES